VSISIGLADNLTFELEDWVRAVRIFGIDGTSIRSLSVGRLLILFTHTHKYNLPAA
jgi:hypothetical protein